MKRLFILLLVLLTFGLVRADYILSGGLGLPALIEQKVKELDKDVKKWKTNNTYVDALNGDDSYDGLSPTVGKFPTGPKKTIQAGVDTTNLSGTCHVASGTYAENIVISKAITLLGNGRPKIDPISEGPAVIFEGSGANNASISGFEIKGATGEYGWGIRCNSSSPTIANNIITGNVAGLLCWENSSPTIRDNEIINNAYSGIACMENSSPTITNNTLMGNNSNGIYCKNSSSPTITNNIITGNGWPGIYCDFSSPTITNNTIANNDQSGIYCYGSSSPTITNNIITGNGITGNDYYGISNDSDYPGSPLIDYNCVWENGLNGDSNYYNCQDQGHDISRAPQFIGGGNYHLMSISPCINRGLNTASGIPDKDKGGNPRIVGGTVDMGAYEYQGSLPTTITGRLTKDGDGVGGVWIWCWDDTLGEDAEGTSTGPDGYYTLTVVSDHSYCLGIDNEDLPPGYIFSPGRGYYCEVSAGATNMDFEFILPEAQISGQVTDSLGNPVPDVYIWLEDEAGVTVYDTNTNANGNYSIGVLGGNYNVYVWWKEGYISTPEFRRVTVPPDATGIDFVLTPIE